MKSLYNDVMLQIEEGACYALMIRNKMKNENEKRKSLTSRISARSDVAIG